MSESALLAPGHHCTVLPGTDIGVETWVPAGPSRRPVVLAVHGAFSGSWTWERVGPWLAEHGWPVVAVNWRGHHLSTSLPDAELASLSVDDLVADLDTVVEQIDRPVVVVAHSIGSVVALAWGTTTESAPLAMALIAPAPPAGSEPGYPSSDPRDCSAPVTAPAESVAAALFFHGLSPEDLQRYADLLQDESPTVLNEIGAGYEVARSRITWPVLVLGAALDALQPPEDGIDRGVANWSLAAFEQIDDAGHFVPVEAAWSEVAGQVDHWLDAVLPDLVHTTHTTEMSNR